LLVSLRGGITHGHLDSNLRFIFTRWKKKVSGHTVVQLIFPCRLAPGLELPSDIGFRSDSTPLGHIAQPFELPFDMVGTSARKLLRFDQIDLVEVVGDAGKVVLGEQIGVIPVVPVGASIAKICLLRFLTLLPQVPEELLELLPVRGGMHLELGAGRMGQFVDHGSLDNRPPRVVVRCRSNLLIREWHRDPCPGLKERLKADLDQDCNPVLVLHLVLGIVLVEDDLDTSRPGANVRDEVVS